MALFETMRENTKVILWITVVAFVGLIFLAWGADFSTRSGRGAYEAGVLAKVNGEEIHRETYEQAVQRARAILEQRIAGTPDEGFYLMLRANAWDQLIDQELMRQAARRHKITVSDREVATALLSNPPPEVRANPSFYTEDGQFDMQGYQSWVASTNTARLEQEYRDFVAQQKLRMLLMGTVTVPESEVRQAWLERNQEASIAYVQIPYQLAKRSEVADDEVLKGYFAEHREDFRWPERVKLEYVKIEKRPSADDSLEARAEIEEVLQELRRGDDYDLLVQAYSMAPRSRWGGEEGVFMTRGEFQQPAIAEAAFSLEPGTVSELIETPAGLHLLKVVERKTEEEVEQVKIAEIFIPVRMSYDTNYELRERALDLVDSTATASFATAAEELGLEAQETGHFDPSGFIPGLGSLPAAKRFATEARVTETSRPIESGDAWYVLHLAERLPASLPKYEEVARSVHAAHLTAERKRIAREHAEALLAQVSAGQTLEAAAATDSIARVGEAEGVNRQGSIRGLGRDLTVAGAIFARGESGLVPRVVLGNQGAYLVRVLEIDAFDEEAFAEAEAQLRAELVQQKQEQLMTAWMEDLRAEARIEDFRPVVASL